jgi:hypothetical protein
VFTHVIKRKAEIHDLNLNIQDVLWTSLSLTLDIRDFPPLLPVNCQDSIFIRRCDPFLPDTFQFIIRNLSYNSSLQRHVIISNIFQCILPTEMLSCRSDILILESVQIVHVKGKNGKAIPVTDHGGPQSCETSRLPHFSR